MDEDKKDERSTYNEASFQIARLNNHWERCHTFKTSEQLEKWALELSSAWTELSVDAKKLKGRKEKDNIYFKQMNFLTKHINIRLNNGNYMEAFHILEMKEQLLRQIQDESGKGSKYEDIDAYGMDL